MTLHMIAFAAPLVAADTAGRTLSGVVVPYGQPGRTSAGVLTVAAGAVRLPADLRTVKLFRDHDRSRPVGYAAAAADTPAGLTMTFRIARTADGDQALLEATEGVRDAFSVELDEISRGAGATADVVTDAALTGVAQVPVPAYAAARIATIAAAHHPDTPDTPEPVTVTTTVPPASPPVPPEPDPNHTDPDHDDDDLDDDDDDDADTPADSASPAPTEGTPMPDTLDAAARPQTSRPAARTRARGVTTYLDAAAVIASHARGVITAAELTAALSDVTTAPDVAGATLTPQWVGNLWADDPVERPHVDAITGPRQLDSLTVTGFSWTTGLQVAKWAGNKAAIPSNVPKAEPASRTAQRWAGGVDVAREFVDFGNGQVIADLLVTARDDYRMKTDEACLADLFAVATDVGTHDTPIALFAAVVTAFRRGRLGTVFLGANVWGALAELPGTNMLGGSVSFAGGNLGGVSFVPDPDLDPNDVLALDKRAATFYERGPITIDALDIARGGVDEAVHGYTATLVNRAAYVVDGHLSPGDTPPAGGAASTGTTSKTAK